MHFNLGILYDEMDEDEKSIEAMKRTIELSPDHAEALNYLGYTYAEKGVKLDEAEKFIKRALKVKPTSGYIVDSLGWVYFKKGNVDEALKTLEKANDLVSDDPIITEHLGDAYMEKGMKERALEVYERSLKLDPKRVDVQKKMELC